jgi:hypothetical protein
MCLVPAGDRRRIASPKKEAADACDLFHHVSLMDVTICAGIALAFAANGHTFISTSTNRKEGDPMSNEFSVLVTGMGVVVKSVRQPSQ